MNEQIDCIICDANEMNQFIKVSDRLSLDSEYFNLVKCQCDFIYLNPRPDSKDILLYYESEIYDPHNSSNSNWNKIYNFVQRITLRWKFNKIVGELKNGRLLDIGGGKGDFAEFMISQGWEVTMQDSFVDINADHISYQFITELHHIEDSQSFDIITLWHSLEHIHNIQYLFNHINRLLSKEGKLFIAVPNIHAPEKKAYGVHWAPYDAPRHLYHFELETLRRLCKKNNFEVFRQYSLFQDTPYNIMLSISKMSLYQLFKFVFVSVISLFKTILRGPEHSSSFLVICKRY